VTNCNLSCTLCVHLVDVPQATEESARWRALERSSDLVLKLPCLGIPNPNALIIRLKLAMSMRGQTHLCSQVISDWIPGNTLDEAFMSRYTVYTFYLISLHFETLLLAYHPWLRPRSIYYCPVQPRLTSHHLWTTRRQ
jgi:hypothetical protein